MADTSTLHRRKQLRKGTKSCWECKRRKIRCDFAQNESACVSCLDRGTKCIGQEYADEAELPTGSQLGQQIDRVETLLEKLLEKVDSNNIAIGRVLGTSRDNFGIDVLTPSSTSSSQYEGAPVLSLFDNALFGREPHDGSCGQNQGAMYASNLTSITRQNSSWSRTPSKLEILRRELLTILPSQHDVDILCKENYGWWVTQRHVFPHLEKFPDPEISKQFTVQGVSQAHPIVITRLLLSIALCIQQLPSSYDPSRLHLRASPKHHMNQYMDVATSITSDDELIGSIEGIECLILQGAFHINLGNIRRAWFCFRRAMNVGQLMGLHRPLLPSSGPIDSTLAWRQHFLWLQLIKGDCFISLLLGVPSSGGQSFPFEDTEEWLSVEEIYNKHLCAIACLVIDRNQGEITHAFSNTQNIDERLDNLAKRMPSSWWELPKTVPTSQSKEVVQQMDRVMSQLWHFELEILVHLPFMLRASADRIYEYSRQSCLAASRGFILRWIYMQNRSSGKLVCRVYQFQALTSAIILLIGIIQPTHEDKSVEQLQQEEEDSKMVNQIKQKFKDMLDFQADPVLSQSIDALNSLQSVNFNPNRGGNLRLNIPFFGTVSVSQAGSNGMSNTQSSRPVPQQLDNENPQIGVDLYNSQNMLIPQPPYTPLPAVSFTSNHFPTSTTEAAEWQLSDSDTIIFDSLINTDLEGNWNF